MKVYTEVNYIWKDNKLIQTDSKSYDYEGEVESCHWYHSHGGGTLNKIATKAKETYTGSDIEKGVTSGTSALKAGYDKMREDNPDPNLNVQTPKQLWEKGRQALHDATTNASEFINRNTDSIYTNPNEESTDDPKPKPKPDTIPDTIPDEDTSLIAGFSDDVTQGGGYGKKRKGEQSRKQANLTGSRGSSILTS